MLPGLITTPARFNEGVAAQVSLAYVPTAGSLVAAGTSLTFPGTSIGTAQADRIVYLCASSESSTGLGANVSSISIGGRPATRAHISTNTGVSPNLNVEIWYAYVPTGTTADVVFNFNASTSARIYIAIFRAVNVTIPVFATANNAVASGVSIGTTLTIPALGAAVAIVVASNEGSTNNWTGLTERTDDGPGSSQRSGTASNEVPAGDASRSITVTSGVSSARALVAISIR